MSKKILEKVGGFFDPGEGKDDQDTQPANVIFNSRGIKIVTLEEDETAILAAQQAAALQEVEGESGESEASVEQNLANENIFQRLVSLYQGSNELGRYIILTISLVVLISLSGSGIIGIQMIANLQDEQIQAFVTSSDEDAYDFATVEFSDAMSGSFDIEPDPKTTLYLNDDGVEKIRFQVRLGTQFAVVEAVFYEATPGTYQRMTYLVPVISGIDTSLIIDLEQRPRRFNETRKFFVTEPSVTITPDKNALEFFSDAYNLLKIDQNNGGLSPIFELRAEAIAQSGFEQDHLLMRQPIQPIKEEDLAELFAETMTDEEKFEFVQTYLWPHALVLPVGEPADIINGSSSNAAVEYWLPIRVGRQLQFRQLSFIESTGQVFLSEPLLDSAFGYTVSQNRGYVVTVADQQSEGLVLEVQFSDEFYQELLVSMSLSENN